MLLTFAIVFPGARTSRNIFDLIGAKSMRDDLNKQQERRAKALRGEEGTAPQPRLRH
jgi:hypothetical protein